MDLPREKSWRKRRAFLHLLDRYKIDTVVHVIMEDTPYKGRRAYRKAGFDLRTISEPYEVWTRQKETAMRALEDVSQAKTGSPASG